MSDITKVISNKTISLLSFKPDGSQSYYNLKSLEEPIIQKLRVSLDKLETIPQTYLCMRGDSFHTQEQHNIFFEQDLVKLFIVGEKSKYHFRNETNREINYHNNSDLTENIKDEIRSLVAECNEIVRNKPGSHNIQGRISEQCLNFILNQSQTSLEGWQIFFLSFLHNNGRPHDFKSSSPFLSLTHGCKKLRIARKFALSRCSHGKGIVYVYSLNTNWPYYFLSKDLSSQLNKYGIQWYRDIHHEILLLNGMYPHFLIGVIEISKKRNLRFILNPWIYKEFREGKDFNYTEGVNIDQKKFSDFAQDLGYKSWFFHEHGKQMEYISDFRTLEVQKVFRV